MYLENTLELGKLVVLCSIMCNCGHLCTNMKVILFWFFFVIFPECGLESTWMDLGMNTALPLPRSIKSADLNSISIQMMCHENKTLM